MARQSRPLEPLYPVAFFDALREKVHKIPDTPTLIDGHSLRALVACLASELTRTNVTSLGGL